MTYGTTYLVADSALSSADNLQKLAATTVQWITRVPATLRNAQTARAPAHPQRMAPLTEGSRAHVLPSTYGGGQHRWGLIASAHRQAQAQRTVDKQLRKHSDQEVQECKKRCRPPFACEADAPQALATCEPGLQATCLPAVTVRPPPRYGQRGRPSQDAPPARVVYAIEGARASSLATHQALIDQHRWFILAPNELAEATVPPQEVLPGYQGQARAARGCRFLQDPQFCASAFSRKKPERIMAL